MKKLLLILVSILIYINVQAQNAVVPLSGLDSLFAIGDAYYDQFPDSVQKQGRKAHERWKQFWSVRGVHQPDSGQDHFSPYMFAVGDHVINSQQLDCDNGLGTNLYDGSWALKGPKNMPSQNQGLVQSVWANPNSPYQEYPEILAGFQGGGLWKKEAGVGATAQLAQQNWENTPWINLTDNSNNFIGTLDVSCIAVDPTNTDNIFIAVNGNNNGLFGPYGFGIYYSTDGGLSWVQDTDFASQAASWGLSLPVVTRLVFNPHNNDELFAISGGVGSDQKVMFRNINGPIWTDLNFSSPILALISPFMLDLEFHATNPNLIYVTGSCHPNWGSTDPLAQFQRGELWQYDRSGAGTWTEISMDKDPTGLAILGPISPKYMKSYAIFMHPTNNHLYAMVSRYTPMPPITVNTQLETMLVRYNTGNGTWQFCNDWTSTTYNEMVMPGWFNTYVFSPTDPNVFYGGDVEHYTYHSQNGVNFDRWATSAHSPIIPADPTWCHDDFRCTYVVPNGAGAGANGVNDLVVFGNDGGICIKRAGRDPAILGHATLEVVPHIDLATTQWYSFDVSEQDGLIAGGVMHNGMYTYDKRRIASSVAEWLYGYRGDGYNAEFDKTDRDYAYGTTNQRLCEYDFNTISGLWTYKVGAADDPNGPPPPGPVDDNMWHVQPIEVVETTNELLIGYSIARTDVAPNFTSPFGLLGGNLPTLDQDYDGNGVLKKFKLDETGTHGFFAFEGRVRNKRLVWMKPGPIYEDITPPEVSDDPNGEQITALVMDPADPAICYIGLGGLGDYNNNNTGCNPWNRVLKFDGNILPPADPWTCISDGLPALPVNCLAYRNGTDEEIYAGTDVGVFVYVKALNQWDPFNRRRVAHWNGMDSVHCMPHMMVTDLDINYCENKLYAATFGRGIWESDLSNDLEVEYDIAQNTTVNWSSSKYIEGNIVIRSGATLFINGTSSLGTNIDDHDYTTVIHMPKNGRIDIEKGGKLVVSYATITNSCDVLWDGIYAHGDGTSPQIINSSYFYPDQGYVILSKCRIENADNAVNNFGGQDPWPNAGGVIEADFALFNNNRHGIQFLKYQNSNPGPSNDNSHFNVCKFRVDNDDLTNFWAHITMWGVRGIPINNCSFTNNQSADLDHQQAIKTIDASYHIYDNGMAPNYPSRIEGFYRGLNSTGYDGFYTNFITPIIVKNTEFDKNELGIHFNNMWYPQIENNNFKIGAKQTPEPSGTYQYYSLGSKLDHVSNFTYCNNDHRKIYAPPSNNCNFQYTSGTEVYNTGDMNQPIQKNNYVDLYVGNDAAYTCGGTNALGDNVGLNYSCNTNTGNSGWDFILQANAIVREIQSDDFNSNNATGNVFSQNSTVKHWDHVSGNAPVRYHHLNTTPPHPEIPQTVTSTYALVPAPGNEGCDNGVCPRYVEIYENPGRDRTGEMTASKTSYHGYETDYNSASAAYQALIDDGDTPQTETDIENSTTADQMQIRSEMLATSPYVSEVVLRTLAEEGIVSQAILFEIIMANPEASQSKGFIKFLKFEMPNPLPTYMIDLIKASWNGQTARAGLENNISGLLSKMTEVRNHIVHMYAVDSILYNEDSMYAWMNKIPSLRGQYLNVEYWLGKKDVMQAESTLNAIPNYWEMNEDEFKNHNAYVDLFNFKKSLIAKNKDINQLDASEIAQLQVIADHADYTFGRDAARNALCFFYQICYPAHQLIPTVSSNKQIEIKELKKDKPGIKVYPNPAKDHVTFQLVNNDGRCTDCRFFVSDLQGRKVYEGSLDKLSGLHIWDTKNVAPGTYIYEIKTNLKVESGKIIILK